MYQIYHKIQSCIFKLFCKIFFWENTCPRNFRRNPVVFPHLNHTQTWPWTQSSWYIMLCIMLCHGGDRGNMATQDSTLMKKIPLPAPGTSTGLNRSPVLPMPSWPRSFIPQHFTVPPVTMTHVWACPMATALAYTPGVGREKGKGEGREESGLSVGVGEESDWAQAGTVVRNRESCCCKSDLPRHLAAEFFPEIYRV